MQAGEVAVLVSPIRRESQHIPLASLFQSQDEYTIPEIQREFEWPLDLQLLFIAYLLFGIPVDPIKVNVHYDEVGALVKDLMDGQQRFTTIMRFFKGQLRTPTKEQMARISPNSKMPLLAPGRFYRELPEPMRRRFNAYAIEIVLMENVPEEWIPEIFRGLNNHIKLKIGQMLWANKNSTADWSRAFSEYGAYPIWSTVFRRPTGKKYPVERDKDRMRYLASMMAFAIEMTGTPYTVELRQDGLKKWASGIYDEKLTDAIVAQVEQRFDSIARVFYGAEATSRLDMVLMYQAVAKLESYPHFYDLRYAPMVRVQKQDGTEEEKGCLVTWHNQIKLSRRVAGKRAFSPISFLGERYEQNLFWDEQLPQLVAILERTNAPKATHVDEAYLAEMATSGAW